MSSGTRPKIPLVVLGGRDRQGTELPASGRDQHPLIGFKGAKLTVAGRPLIAVVMERMAATGVFGPIYVAGPAAVYEQVVPGARIIDTDASFGDNLHRALDTVLAEHDPAQVAFTTSDILPHPADLERIVADLEHHQPLDFWMLQCRVPADWHELGASAWKPRYRLRPEGEGEAVPVLPGHLVIADPKAVRLELVYRLFELLYRTRNRPLAHRTAVLLRSLLWGLLLDDLRRLAGLRRPRMLWEVVYNSLVAARKLGGRGIDVRELENRMRKVYIHHRHRRRFPGRRGRIAVLDALSLAKDIDTVEEAREVERQAVEPSA